MTFSPINCWESNLYLSLCNKSLGFHFLPFLESYEIMSLLIYWDLLTVDTI